MVLAGAAGASGEEEPAPAGNSMRTKTFLGQLDHERIVTAIKEAEAKSSGEIRVFIQRGAFEGDPVIAAQKKFHELGMDATKERNGILLFVLPRAQKFAVIGDERVHQKCGPEFWQRLVESMREHFKREEFTDALVEAIETAGQLLAQHFPRQDSDRNELSDQVVEG